RPVRARARARRRRALAAARRLWTRHTVGLSAGSVLRCATCTELPRMAYTRGADVDRNQRAWLPRSRTVEDETCGHATHRRARRFLLRSLPSTARKYLLVGP